MSNFFGGGGRVNQPVQPATGLRIQSAINGTPIPIVHGLQRVAGNLLDYEGFDAQPVSSSGSSGKGGVLGTGKGGQPTAYNYSVTVIFGLAEGPLAAVDRVWNNKTVEDLGDLNLTPSLGYVGQPVWPFMASSYPQTALAYNSLAWAGADILPLGTSPELPNLNFEVQGAIGAAVTEAHTITAGAGQSYTASYFSLAQSVTEQVTVPYAAPYQVTAQNPNALNALPVIDGSIGGTDPYSYSAGVVYTATGAPFNRVEPGPPATAGEYSVAQLSNGTWVYTFAAGDAGQLVTIIDLAIGQAQNAAVTTGTTTAGSAVVTALASTSGISQGAIVLGAGIPTGATVVSAVGSGSFTGNTHAGQNYVDGVATGLTPVVGAPVQDSSGAIPTGTAISAFTPATVTLDQAAATSGQTIVNLGLLCSCSVSPGSNLISFVSPTAGLVEGMGYYDLVAGGAGVFPAGAYVTGISGTTVTMSAAALNSGGGEAYFYFQVSATVAAGSPVLQNPQYEWSISTYLSLVLPDSLGAFPDDGGDVVAVTEPVVYIDAAATASITGDTLSYAAQVTLSQAASASAAGVTLTFLSAFLYQVIGTPGPGEFALNVYQAGNYGQYVFGDTAGAVVITDVPDADPAASLTDFLANPRYGCGFPAANIGDLSLLSDYAFATGLFISPALVASQAANSYLKDFSTGLNGEFVWSAGLLTFIPYGDATLTGNGRTYTPPLAAGPIYSLGDDDYLPNEGTASIGVSAFTSDDPVVCVRTRQSDAYNDVKVEYLDRGNSYNPAIAEAQDDAAINLFGLRPADSKQLHFFCIEAAALASAQLQLGRQQVRNQYSFTVPWYFILLDPMDVIALTDAALGLEAQLVRVLEITENQQDWSLTFTAEEVLDGAGSTPQYGSQPKAGYAANYNLTPGTPVAPVIFEPPVAISASGGLEIWLLTGAAVNYGGADVWVSSDGATYKLAGRISGGASRVGVTTADFPAGSDPDTADTLAVDLTGTAGSLISGTQADADQGHTLCVVGGYAYAPAPTLSTTSGGSLAAASYYARATYVFASGEGPPSPEDVLAVAANELLVAASLPAQNGATGWNLYVGAASGAETRQNAAPIAIGTAWTEPTSGLIAGTAPAPEETGYELVSYETARLTATYKYSLGTYLRRGLYGSTVSDHPAGSSFARVDGTQFVYPYDKSQIGETIFFKLTPFNSWQGGEPDTASVQPYAYTLEGPPAPGSVTGFSAQQSGGAVVFAWNDLTGDGFIAYDLLYGPQGGAVASATFLTQAGRGTEMTNASVPPGAWTFYIRGHDTLSGLVGPASSINLAIANLNAVIEFAPEAPDWLGGRSGFLVHYTGVLVPDSTKRADQLSNAQLFETFIAFPVANPTYTCANVLDTAFNGDFRLWAAWSAAAGGNNANESGEIAFQLDVWQSGASDPLAFAPWGNSGLVSNARYARGQIVENTAVPAFVAALSVTADTPVATYAIPSLAVASGGTTITFASAAATPPLPAQFHTAPSVQVTPVSAGAVSGSATSVSATGCVVTLFNASGTAVAGTASIIIAGA